MKYLDMKRTEDANFLYKWRVPIRTLLACPPQKEKSREEKKILE